MYNLALGYQAEEEETMSRGKQSTPGTSAERSSSRSPKFPASGKLRVWYFLLRAAAAADDHCVTIIPMERPSPGNQHLVTTRSLPDCVTDTWQDRATSCLNITGWCLFDFQVANASAFTSSHSLGAKDEVLERCAVSTEEAVPLVGVPNLKVVAVTDGDVAVPAGLACGSDSSIFPKTR